MINHSILEPHHLRNQNPEAVRLADLKKGVGYSVSAPDFFERLGKDPKFVDSYRKQLTDYRTVNTSKNKAVLRDAEFSGMLGIPAIYSIILGIGLAGHGVSDLRRQYRNRNC